jgi:hypothetical protein
MVLHFMSGKSHASSEISNVDLMAKLGVSDEEGVAEKYFKPGVSQICSPSCVFNEDEHRYLGR